MMIKLLIADDEPLACEDLSRRLKKEKGFEIAGEAHDGHEVLSAIEKLKPDAVFLDIQMPGLDGLEVASRLSRTLNPPVIVFLTGCHEYAMEAFDANAIAYLLKPINEDKLKETLFIIKSKFRDTAGNKARLVSLDKALAQRGLVGKLGSSKPPFDLKEVYFFKISGAKITAQKKSEEVILDIPLKNVLLQLGDEFMQVHENYIVNASKIKDCKESFGGYCQITLFDISSKIPVSRKYAAETKARCGKRE